jgi:predicted nucleic acid-binding protein
MAVFVDTGAWFALSVPRDPDHSAAVGFLSENRERLVTSDYIWSELLTLFRARGETPRVARWVRQFEDGDFDLVRASEGDFTAATQIFLQFADKHWSFTDCVSRVMMQRLGITRAFAFDDHFRQFGTVAVVP